MLNQKEFYESIKSDARRLALSHKKVRFFDGTIPPDTGWTRFNTLEYTCRFAPDGYVLNPYQMAADLYNEGIKIYFDDSSISVSENKTKENKVMRLIKTQRAE